MFFIFVTRTYSAAVSGKVLKSVRCDKCGGNYAYHMVRRGFARSSSAYGIGNASAKAAAEQGARRKLEQRLAKDSDPVGCPDCGWVQAHMVADLRRRSHRWLRWVAWVTSSLGLVSALIAILSATEAFHRPIDPDQSQSIAILLAASVGIWGAALQGRSLLARMINPNRNYPERPGIMPGVPKPFKPGTAPHATDVAGDPWTPQLSPSAPTENTTTTARPLIAYEAKPPQLQPGGWVTVQLLDLRHPPRCSCCLGHTESLRSYRCGPLATVPIPLCDKCRKYYQGERAWILFMAGAAIGIFGAIALALPHSGGVILTLISTAAALAVGVYIASVRTAPAHFSRFSAAQNTVRIRFRNPAYVHALLEGGRVV